MTTLLRNIVVGVDLTPASEAAFHQAVRFARRDQATLHLVHVVDRTVAGDVRSTVQPDEPAGRFLERLQLEATERMRQWVQIAGPTELRSSIVVRSGRPASTLLTYLEEQRAELLVLGEGASEQELGLGITAARCVRKSPVPVLLVRPGQSSPFRRVALWIDFSPASAPALEQAVRIARSDGASLDIIHVYTPPWQVQHYRAPSGDAAPAQQREFRAELDAYLNQFLKPFGHELAGLPLQRHFIGTTEPASRQVGQFVQLHQDDLVVLGVRERSPLRIWWGDSRTERLARKAACSLLRVGPSARRVEETLPEPVRIEPESRAA